MRAVVVVAVFAVFLGLAVAFSDPEEAKPARGNLPKDASLRVGVKKRVDCARKTRTGALFYPQRKKKIEEE